MRSPEQQDDFLEHGRFGEEEQAPRRSSEDQLVWIGLLFLAVAGAPLVLSRSRCPEPNQPIEDKRPRKNRGSPSRDTPDAATRICHAGRLSAERTLLMERRTRISRRPLSGVVNSEPDAKRRRSTENTIGDTKLPAPIGEKR